ncbi:MAG: hypothetical protein V1770_03955 [bacterium]
MSKFLLLLGPSGVGKSAIIDELSKLDKRFIYISPYMTRPLRPGERNKVSVSNEHMNEIWRCGELLVINELYGGIRYGTPRLPIVEALATGNFPMLDWPINRLEVMTQAFHGQLFVVYVSPPSIDVLRQRLAKDGRDADGARLTNATKGLQQFWSSRYVGAYDYEIVSEDGRVAEIAEMIYSNYLKSF